MTEQEQPKNDFMHKLALQIVERRNLVFLIVILGTIFTIFSRSWVKVESDLTTYLPKTSETRMGLDIMEKEFTTYGSADVMVANITPDEADQLNDELAGLRGIQMIEYDDTTAHYNNVSALYSITFDYPEDDDQCLETLESVKEYLKDYDIYVSTSLGNTQEETIEREVNVIMVYVAIIIVVVHLPDLCGSSRAAAHFRGGHDPQHGYQLPAGHHLVRFQLGHEHSAAGPFAGLRHHLLQPF